MALLEQSLSEMRSDEAGSTGYEKSHAPSNLVVPFLAPAGLTVASERCKFVKPRGVSEPDTPNSARSR